ncbi:hypothetical protein ACHAXT_008665 [Thalassiosira profunda]
MWSFLVTLCILAQEVLPNGELCADAPDANNRHNRVPEDCTLVMAPSGIANSGWGVFTLTSRKRGERLMDRGDIIVHVPDPNPRHAQQMRRLIWEYLWDGQETGGHYEGHRVFSATSGFGSLANGLMAGHNIKHGSYSVDDAGLNRGQSPGAGAISHHHNFTWTASKDLDAGEELFVDFGADWFRERGFEDSVPTQKFSVSHLRDVGYCLDNVVSGPSLIEGAGRGAFATRDLAEGTTIAPVPVLALSRSSLEMSYEKADGTTLVRPQLLLNYCFGHANSSLLLYPYSHGVNYINHDLDSTPNAKLRWSKQSEAYFQKPFAELQQSSDTQLMLELVAIRPISKGEEIVIDYGPEWAKAWDAHIKSWRPSGNGTNYWSAERMNNDDKFSGVVLTQKQQSQSDWYPADVFTSCYYRFYSDDRKNKEPKVSSGGARTQSIAKWSPEMLAPRNLRPCIVLERDKDVYTVHILNRPTLSEAERIPKGHVHIVTGVPREALEFSDKIYTTDQHLEAAFRKEMSLGDLFPRRWMDLL